MILYQSEYNGKKIEIGIAYLTDRKRPCLVIRSNRNEIAKYASFNNEDAAREFMDIFADFLGMPRIDWTGDDIPWGLLRQGEEE